MVPPGRIELPTPPLPRECSTPELRRRGRDIAIAEAPRQRGVQIENFLVRCGLDHGHDLTILHCNMMLRRNMTDRREAPRIARNNREPIG